MILTNDSNHSTIAVSCNLEKSVAVEKKRSSSNSRKVRFDEKCNQYFANANRCAEECHLTWYQTNDFKSFRSDSRQIVQSAIKKKRSSFAAILEALFRVAAEVDFEMDDASLLLNETVERDLERLYEDRNNNENWELLGLEGHIAPTVRRERKNRRQALQEVVLDIQVECHHGLWASADEMDAEMRDSCANFSQAPCLFAQLLALAQSKTTTTC